MSCFGLKRPFHTGGRIQIGRWNSVKADDHHFIEKKTTISMRKKSETFITDHLPQSDHLTQCRSIQL